MKAMNETIIMYCRTEIVEEEMQEKNPIFTIYRRRRKDRERKLFLYDREETVENKSN